MTVISLIDRNFRGIVQRGFSVGEAIDQVIKSIRAARIRSKAIRELQSLSDAQLYDIGIPRYEIRDVVEATARDAARKDRTCETGNNTRLFLRTCRN